MEKDIQKVEIEMKEKTENMEVIEKYTLLLDQFNNI
jgi:hypothetical protein